MNKYIYKITFHSILECIINNHREFRNRVDCNFQSPIVQIFDNETIALSNITRFSDYVIIEEFRNMLYHLFSYYNFPIKNTGDPTITFYIENNGLNIGYYVTTKPNYETIKNIIDEGKVDKIYVVFTSIVNDDSIKLKDLYYTGKKQYRSYLKYCEFYTINEIVRQFGEEDYQEFTHELNNLNEKIHGFFSFRTIISPSKDEMNDFRLKELNYLLNIDFSDLLSNVWNSQKNILKTNFEKNAKYLVGNNSFSNSFISSEWNYFAHKNVLQYEEIEQTAIVAGYLKTVEQLLYKLKTSVLQITSSESTSDMLKDLINLFCNDNSDLFVINDHVKYKVIKKTLSIFKNKYRNQYFHKSNIYTPDEISEIRNLTLFCLYLILGSVDKPLTEYGFIPFSKVINEKPRYSDFSLWLDNIAKSEIISFDSRKGLCFYVSNKFDDVYYVTCYLENNENDLFGEGHENPLPRYSFPFRSVSDNKTQIYVIKDLLIRYLNESDNNIVFKRCKFIVVRDSVNTSQVI